eukprot:TRINITY_DN2180_c0_g1_i3.p1 TRINITY_DN2180_c0_g1~~TRINITY_DN2180_c0_g1_i3.p1  ORF type:complete len:266 (-),score=47.85 TRINITY_DN2180_c0_g1_i3:332-1129(-)
MNLLLESAVLLVLLVVSVFGLLLFIVRKNSGVGKQSSGGGRLKVSTGLAAIKGWRETMEDDHALFDDLHNHEEYGKIFSKFGSGLALYCGIYDGHRGSTTSHFLAKRLHKNIFTHPKFNPNGDVMRAIADSHVKTDNEFVAENKGKNDGSTSVVALILETKLYIANLGDSEAILCKSGDALDFEVLTKIHKPTDPDERKRIEDANGVVFNGRLSGVIAVSRSFGDVDLKVPFDEGGAIILVGAFALYFFASFLISSREQIGKLVC